MEKELFWSDLKTLPCQGADIKISNKAHNPLFGKHVQKIKFETKQCKFKCWQKQHYFSWALGSFKLVMKKFMAG